MNYAKTAFTDAIKQLQEKHGSRKSYERMERFRSEDGLSPREIPFIQERDSFYTASIGENEFPYIQHRGGPKGFLKVLDKKTLGFLDFSGNMQYITVGNVQQSDKVALIMVDYPNKARMKVYARAEIVELGQRPELEQQLKLEDYAYKAERIILYHIEAFDWNCPQHITPRFTVEEIQEAFADQTAYVKQLEEQVQALKKEMEVE